MASYIPIPIHSVARPGGGADTFIEGNPNAAGNGNVLAFCACFIEEAADTAQICGGLPLSVILAIWGGESGWGSGEKQVRLQNFANITFTSPDNPPYNIGYEMVGEHRFAIFPGLSAFAEGFARFMQNSTYSRLHTYLQKCRENGSVPDAATCLRRIADSGYCGNDADTWYNGMCGLLTSVDTALTRLTADGVILLDGYE